MISPAFVLPRKATSDLEISLTPQAGKDFAVGGDAQRDA